MGTDAFACVLDGNRSRQRFDAALRHGVHRLSARGSDGCHRADVDDHATALLHHERQYQLRTNNRADEIGLDLFSYLFTSRRNQQVRPIDGRIVYPAIDPSKAFNKLPERERGRIGVTNVELERNQIVRRLVGKRIPIIRADNRTVAQTCRRNRASDAPSRSCNDDSLSFKHGLPSRQSTRFDHQSRTNSIMSRDARSDEPAAEHNRGRIVDRGFQD